MAKSVKEHLQKLTGKQHIYLVRRGNVAIKELLSIFKDKTVLLADQGGWLTYDVYAKKSIPIETDNGIINPDDLHIYSHDYVLLVNSMAGYTFPQDMGALVKGKYFVINDASGSIGTENAKYGHYIFGSFGKHKPINLGTGAFIASDHELNIQEDFDFDKEKELLDLLEGFDKRLKTLHATAKKIKKDLKHLNVVHPHKEGINVIVAFNDDKEKEQIIEYCNKNNYPFTECPRFIRVLQNAISIEVKRL